MAKQSRTITMSPLVLDKEDDLDLWEFVNPSDGEYSDDSFSVDSLSDDDVISLDDASFVSPSVISSLPQILPGTDGGDLTADLDLDDGHVDGDGAVFGDIVCRDGADFGDKVCRDGADFGDNVCRERAVDDNDLGWAHKRMGHLGRGSRYVVGITYGGYVNRDGCDDDEDEDRSGEDGDYDYSYDLDDELVPRSVSKKLGRQRMKKLGKRAIAKVSKVSKTYPFSHVKPGYLRGKVYLGVKVH